MGQREGKQCFIGIDLGGTRTKFGLVADDGTLIASSTVPTRTNGGGSTLQLLQEVARDALERARGMGLSPSCLGVATPGWVDTAEGRVLFASGNLPGWSGADVASGLHTATGLPVWVENDANALAVAERHFGLARRTDDFVCVTLGTGIGSGYYVGGRLHCGANQLSMELGHIPIQVDGLPCSCGMRGCLEPYANAAAMLRYADGSFGSAEEVIAAAGSGDRTARSAIRTFARFLALGCVAVIHLVDPSMFIFAGGLTQNNPALLEDLEEEIRRRMLMPEARDLKIRFSELGYFGGVLGAAAVALEKRG